MTLFTLPQRIYVEDVDAQGLVYHANYLKFFERARTEMLRDIGFNPWASPKQAQIFFVVRRCEVDFKKPAYLDDQVVLQTHISDLSGARLHFDQVLEREGETLVTLKALLACVTPEGRPLRIPRALCALLTPLISGFSNERILSR